MPLYSSERGTTNLRQHCEECKGKESDFRVNRNLATSGVSPQERRRELGYLATNFGQRIDFRILEYFTPENSCSQHLDSLVQVFPQTLASASMLFISPPSSPPRHSSVSNFRTIFTLDRVFSICTTQTLGVHFSLASGTFSRW